MSSINVLSPLSLGAIALKNRVVLAPLTRNRASAGAVPSALALTYYTQRAGGGLLITEGTQIVPEGQGYPDTPGIHSEAQVEGWRKITDAVHAAGGRIALQLWHVGRISHSAFQPGGKLPVAPSAIAPEGHVYGPGWKKLDYETPHALTVDEIAAVVESYAVATRNAKRAGFDGVEIHGANGYLIDQFLRDGSNKRTDAYGGSIENRLRFLTEVTAAVVGAWDAGHVGLRLSPHNPYNSMSDSDPAALFVAAAKAVSGFGLAFLHVLEPVGTVPALARAMKTAFGGPTIVNGGYTQETANAAIASGEADAIAFGKLFIANPDLPARFAAHAPLNAWDAATFYGGDAKGYTDYPALELV